MEQSGIEWTVPPFSRDPSQLGGETPAPGKVHFSRRHNLYSMPRSWRGGGQPVGISKAAETNGSQRRPRALEIICVRTGGSGEECGLCWARDLYVETQGLPCLLFFPPRLLQDATRMLLVCRSCCEIPLITHCRGLCAASCGALLFCII